MIASAHTHTENDSDSVGQFWFEKSRAVLTPDGKTVHRGITSKELEQLREIEESRFFNEERLREIVKFNDETSEAPRLRALDWAVTNYSKGHPLVMLVKNEEGVEEAIDPNLSYEGELRKHHRLLFDPFRRGTHIFFEIDGGMVHRTTTGQLTFVRWCLKSGVSKYVEDNLPMIREHMATVTKRGGKEDDVSGEKRRRELTTAPTRRVRGAVTFQFIK